MNDMKPSENKTRYQPLNGNIVGDSLDEAYYSNRYLYEGNPSAYVMAGDRPHLRFCRNRFIFGTLRMFLCGRPLDEFDNVRMEYGPCAVRWTIRDGVRKVFIIDGRVPHALLLETLTDEGAGTMFKKEI